MGNKSSSKSLTSMDNVFINLRKEQNLQNHSSLNEQNTRRLSSSKLKKISDDVKLRFRRNSTPNKIDTNTNKPVNNKSIKKNVNNNYRNMPSTKTFPTVQPSYFNNAREIQPRYVFISLIALSQTWRKTPTDILHSCIILLPIRSAWLYDAQLSQVFNDFHNYLFKDSSFVKFLKFKNQQQLLFFMEDDYTQDLIKDQIENVKKGELYRVHSFWKYFSEKLCGMHDPRLNQKYLPLHLQKAYWIDRFQKNSLFEAGNKKKRLSVCTGIGVDASSISSSIEYHILLELHSNKTKKFQLIKAIIQESNPHLNVVRAYTMYHSPESSPTPLEIVNGNKNNTQSSSSLDASDVEEDDCNEYWISSDYFE